MSEAAAAWGDDSSDAELITASRAGDSSAFGALYERHAGAARSVARQYTRSSADAEDVVGDAFAKVYAIVRGGGGPDVAFRAYLFTVVRRLAQTRAESGRRVQPTDDMATFESAFGPVGAVDDPALAGFERGVVARAYASLPERWQAVLWYTEIERLATAQVAPLLGLTPNGVAALAYRAREGLREAYLQQHLVSAPQQACRAVNGKLGAYVRGGLAKRETAHVQDHLEGCAECRTLVLELGDVNHGLRGIIAPLVLGVAGLAALGAPLPVGVLGAGGLGAGAAGTGVAGAGTGAVGAGTGTGAAGAGAGSGAVGAGASAGSGAVGAGATAGSGAAVATGSGAAVGTGSAAAAGTGAAGAAGGLSTAAVGAAAGTGSTVAGAGGAVAAATGSGAAMTAGSAAAGTAAAGTAGAAAVGTAGAAAASGVGAGAIGAGAVGAGTAAAPVLGVTGALGGAAAGATVAGATGAAAGTGVLVGAGAGAAAGAGATALAGGGIGGLIAAIPGGVAGAVTAGVVGVSLAVGGALADEPVRPPAGSTQSQTGSSAPADRSGGAPAEAPQAAPAVPDRPPLIAGPLLEGLAPERQRPLVTEPEPSPATPVTQPAPADPGPVAPAPDALPADPPVEPPPTEPAPTPASLAVSAEQVGTVLVPGTEQTISVTLVNTGQSSATGLRAALVLPEGVELDDDDGDGEQAVENRWQRCVDDEPGGAVEYCLTALAGGASSLLTAVVDVDDDLQLPEGSVLVLQVTGTGILPTDLEVPLAVPGEEPEAVDPEETEDPPVADAAPDEGAPDEGAPDDSDARAAGDGAPAGGTDDGQPATQPGGTAADGGPTPTAVNEEPGGTAR